MQTVYDVDYFLDKFSRIPEEMWCVGSLQNDDGARCALGHTINCKNVYTALHGGTVHQPELMAFREIFFHLGVVGINNGFDPNYQQPTPKQRILAALKDVKAMQNQVEISDPPVYVEDLIAEAVEA